MPLALAKILKILYLGSRKSSGVPERECLSSCQATFISLVSFFFFFPPPTRHPLPEKFLLWHGATYFFTGKNASLATIDTTVSLLPEKEGRTFLRELPSVRSCFEISRSVSSFRLSLSLTLLYPFGLMSRGCKHARVFAVAQKTLFLIRRFYIRSFRGRSLPLQDGSRKVENARYIRTYLEHDFTGGRRGCRVSLSP